MLARRQTGRFVSVIRAYLLVFQRLSRCLSTNEANNMLCIDRPGVQVCAKHCQRKKKEDENNACKIIIKVFISFFFLATTHPQKF